jgi:hypothetical protein
LFPFQIALIIFLLSADLDGLAVYTTYISKLEPSTLASMGVTSSQLFSLDQIASLTRDRPLGIAVQATQHKILSKHKQCFSKALLRL